MRNMLAAIAAIAAACLLLPGLASGAGICDRTPQIRDRILSSLRNLTPPIRRADCESVSDEDLGKVESMTTGSVVPLAQLQAGDLDGLTALTGLAFPDDRLEYLPSGIFDDLESLTILHLENNRLSDLPPDVFDALANLRTLELSGNLLSTLPVGVFGKTKSLSILHLHRNLLESIPPGAFDRLQLRGSWPGTGLSLHGNRLLGLAEDHALFAGLPRDKITLGSQTAPESPPPCQPRGGFPECPQPDRPPPEEPAPPPDSPSPPPSEPDIARRLAAAEAAVAAQAALIDALTTRIAVLERREAVNASASREMDFVHARLISAAVQRIDAVEAAVPPRRLRLWMAAQPESE